MTAEIFISHASQDRKTAESVCAALETRGFSCWLSSRNIAPGANFAESIVGAISAAKLMLFIFSTNSNNSDEVKKEIVLAGQHKVTVIPLRVEDVVPNAALAYEFATRQWIDLFNGWEQSIEQLVAQILTIIPPTSGIASNDADDPQHAAGARTRRRRSTAAPRSSTADRREGPASPYQLRGDAYAKIGKYDLAIAEYDQAIRDNAQLAAAFHNRGNAHHANGAQDLAIIDYGEAIRLRPDYPSAFNNRGNARLDQGQYARAISDFDEAIRQRPDFALAFSNRGFAHFREGDYERAIEDFSAALKLKPDLAIALENRAKAFEKKGMPALARAADRATAAEIGRARSPADLAAKTAGQPERKETPAALIIAVCVGFLVLFIVAAVIIGAAANQSSSAASDAASDATSAASDAAMAASDAVPAAAPATDASATTADASWAICSGDSPTVSDCSAVIAHGARPAADLSAAHNNRGNIYYAAHDYNRAIEDYNRAIDIDLNYVAYHNRGNAYAGRNETGDYDLAMNDFAEAIRLKPDDAQAYYDRGTARKNAGDTANGEQDLAHARALDPKIGQ